MNTMHAILTALAVLLAQVGVAYAWDGQGMWYQSAIGGPGGAPGPGGGGILGTGGASDHNITCANCHIKGAQNYGTVDFKPTFDPPLSASYKLGQTYQVTITMVGEHLGQSGCMDTAKKVNEFAATFEDDSGKIAGKLAATTGSTASCPAEPPDGDLNGVTFMSGDCHAIVGRAQDGATTSWTFSWTAPTTSTPVTLYYAGVDGDCMMDSLNDDAKVGSMNLGAGVAMREIPDSGNKRFAWIALFPAIAVAGAFRRSANERRRG